MRAKTLCLAAAVAMAFLAWTPGVADDAPVVMDLDVESVDACLDYTPVDQSEMEPALLLEFEGEAVSPRPKPCRACPDQPWCSCTYNGHPRVSCDPCCYSTYTGEICTS
jgi:hypothetical protein